MATQLHPSARQRHHQTPHAHPHPHPHTHSHPSPMPPMFAGVLPSVVDHLDPHLLALATGSAAPAPLDPALFAIEQVVNDVNRGRIAAGDLAMGIGMVREEERQPEPEPEPEPVPVPVTLPPHPQESEQVAVHVELPVDADAGLEDDGIDPALREIVNSLTNAQQSHHPSLPGDTEERDRIDHETIRTTLEDYAAQNGFGSYGAIFGGTFPHSPNNQNLMLPDVGEPEPHPSTRFVPIAPNMSGMTGMSAMSEEATDETVPVKRGRGRPKGSKNKPKPRPPTPEPEPEPPRRRKGRPPKVRSAEEIADIERRKEDKALGIKRKRGRPRKYPELGLVREMRLKKNRAAVQEKIRMLEERARLEAEAKGEQNGQHDQGQVHGHEPDGRNREREHEQAQHDHAREQAHEHGNNHQHQSNNEHRHEIPMEMDMGSGLAGEVALGEQVAAAVAHEHDHTDHYDWPYQDNQTLLDVVHGVGMGMGDDQRMDVGVGVGVGVGVLPSHGHNVGISQGDDMRGVFSLGT